MYGPADPRPTAEHVIACLDHWRTELTAGEVAVLLPYLPKSGIRTALVKLAKDGAIGRELDRVLPIGPVYRYSSFNLVPFVAMDDSCTP